MYIIILVILFLLSLADADAADPKCKYHYTKHIMKFVNKYKSANSTINAIELIDKLSKATGETKLYMADCLGVLNEKNKQLFDKPPLS
jgi:endo-1,4-beta-mannosidase